MNGMNAAIQYSIEGSGSLGEFSLAILLLVGVLLAVFALGSLFDRVFGAE